MALVSNTLASELESMVAVDTEAEGINNFSAAFENYFYDSTCGGVTATPGTLTAASTALKAAMVGVNSAGAAKIAAGIVAFWAVVGASAPTIWVILPPLVSATPPPGLGGLSAAIAAAGAANIAAEASLEQSAATMATAIHTIMLGGLGVATIPPGRTLPIL